MEAVQKCYLAFGLLVVTNKPLELLVVVWSLAWRENINMHIHTIYKHDFCKLEAWQHCQTLTLYLKNVYTQKLCCTDQLFTDIKKDNNSNTNRLATQS